MAFFFSSRNKDGAHESNRFGHIDTPVHCPLAVLIRSSGHTSNSNRIFCHLFSLRQLLQHPTAPPPHLNITFPAEAENPTPPTAPTRVQSHQPLSCKLGKAQASLKICRVSGQKLCLGRFLSSNLHVLVPWKFGGPFCGRFLVDFWSLRWSFFGHFLVDFWSPSRFLLVFWSLSRFWSFFGRFLIVFWSLFGRFFGLLFFVIFPWTLVRMFDSKSCGEARLLGPVVRSCHSAGSFPCRCLLLNLSVLLLSISGGLLPPFSVSLLIFSGVLLCLTVAWKTRAHQHTTLQMF